jgi:cephalosporin hydroxylase
MKDLRTAYKKNTMPDGGGDKGTAHTYIELYEKYMSNNRHNINLLEIGMFYGHSMVMWSEYFIDSKIIGIDTNTSQLHFQSYEYGFEAIQADACSPKTLDIFQKRQLLFDYIIDDGSHVLEHQLASYKIFKSLLKPNGIYFIEDVGNIHNDKHHFLSLNNNVTIHDHRHLKNRSDDVLIVIRN